MADDIGSRGEDPRDVARRRLNVGRRAREAEAARRAGQTSGPPMTPSTQSMVPYQERLPTAPEGGRGGPLAPSGGREMAMPRGESVPAIRREGMPSIRVPEGAAEAMRGAMQSPMARAMGTGRAAAGRAAAEGAMRLSERLLRGGRSNAARMPSPDLGDEAPEPMRAVEGTEMQGPPAPVAAPSPRPRQAARPTQREMTADDLNEIVLRLNRGEKPVTDVEKRLADRMGIAYKKGGMVKPKKYEEGGAVKVPGKKPAMGGPKASASRMRDMISPSERRELDAPLTRQELDRMRESGFKKGGMIKPKGHGMKEEAMEMKGGRYRGGAKEERAEMMMKKGGAVKKAPAKKMAHGGKVPAPKKMMKGGMTSKPKKMMGGGRAMYAKGGMAKGCK